jgi:hypothetical protein
MASDNQRGRSWDTGTGIWDSATGAEIACLKGHLRGVNAAAFSPDGTSIVTAAHDVTARIWDAATGAEIACLNGHEGSVYTAAFSPDGTRIVTASGDGTARIWDASTGAEIERLKGHENSVLTAAFSPDGTRILTNSRHDVTISILDETRNASLLTLGLDGTVNLWDLRSGRRICDLRGRAGIRHARFSWCGRFFATADADGLLTLCSSETATPLWQVATGHNNINAVFPLPGDEGIRILVGGHLETWRREPGSVLSSIPARPDSALSANGWPFRFVSDIAVHFDIDEQTLAEISKNGLAREGMRSLVLQDDQHRSVTLHIPYGPLRTVHRKLRPDLEDLRAREIGRCGLPVWRTAAQALAAHSGAPLTASLRVRAYAESLSFGRLLAWMRSGPLQMGDDAATLLARILTRSDHLAIHSRTAALLGELMTLKLTGRLTRLARDHDVRVTRFSDCIFISGDTVPGEIGAFAHAGKEEIFIPGRLLKQVAAKSGFSLEPYGKVRRGQSAQALPKN